MKKMFKASYHPKAFLSNTKNVKQGLATRTKIASILDRGACTAKAISGDAGTSYSSVMHHLHLMENDEIVEKSDKKPYIWRLTGAGQKRLTEI
jgi:DNA-binding transcriptional ArsR family regulator